MSRPAALNDALKAELCERIAAGETVREVASAEHMPSESTIYRTLANDDAFAERYARARDVQLVRWEDELLEIADDGSNDWMDRRRPDGSTERVLDHEHIARSNARITVRKWLMSKRMPRKYGDRLTHDGDGAGGPIKIQPVINVSLSDPEHPGPSEAGAGP